MTHPDPLAPLRVKFEQFHGGPITPVSIARRVWDSRCAIISFAYPQQLDVALKHARKVRIDNGAFTLWKGGKATDWDAYYRWVEPILKHPKFDGAFIPDVIAGTFDENRALARQWPFGRATGIPVWHLHEPIHWLQTLCALYPRVALGSSGQWATPGTAGWWLRMSDAMDAACNSDGVPMARLHGLRMLDGQLLKHLPMDADSCNVAINIGLDSKWSLGPKSKEARALVLIDRIEMQRAATRWNGMQSQGGLFMEMTA